MIDTTLMFPSVMEPHSMLPSLTPAVTRALELARDVALRLGAADIQPRHLLQGLLDEQEGRAATALAQAGLPLSVMGELFANPAIGAQPTGGDADLTLSRDTQEIVEYAREIAREMSGEPLVAGDHLVLALLRRVASIRQELVAGGLDFSRLESEMSAAVGQPLRLDEPLRLPEPTEQVDTARIVDVNANRAREAVRVVEDYCRFVLDDRFLSNELKRLRHDLVQTLNALPSGHLLEARETLRDVGTLLSTPPERERLSHRDVVQANLKRLQEALRSLEEYGKLRSPQLGEALEKLRYRAYTLERAILLCSNARERLAHARLQVLVTGSLCRAASDWTIQEAIAGGAQIIQLREKELSDRELLERARRVRAWTRKAEVLFIVNDRSDIARLAEADGVHLGQEDLSVREARRIVGPDALIGVSTHNLDQLRQAVLDGASYLGVGPAFPSSTKSFAEFPGLEYVRETTFETSLPIFAIGGVNLDTIGAAIAAGARRVAVSQAICQAEDPRAVAAEIRRILDGLSS